MFGNREMTSKKLHINEEEFNRYLENKMTSTERNTFERELQKHPFETDALEGLNTISPENIRNDLNEIKAKIEPQRRNCFRCFAAAASILLVISAGIVWMEVKDQNTVLEMAETKSIETQEKLHQKLDIIAEPSQLNKEIEKTTYSEEIPQIKDKQETTEIAETTVIQGEPRQKSAAKKTVMISGISQQPEPDDDNLDTGKYGDINEKNSFEQQEKKAKSNQIENHQILHDSPISAVVGAPIAAPPPPKEIVDSKAHPFGGFDNYEIYLNSTALIPENYNAKKAVVKIKFEIDSEGLISDFQNRNSTDTLLFSKAKEIILNGPKWSPEIKDGKQLDSTVKLKIVFRK